MKTTMEIDDELFARAKAVAAQRRVSLKAMVDHALRREISVQNDFVSAHNSFTVDDDGLPTLTRRKGIKVKSTDVSRIMEEEGI